MAVEAWTLRVRRNYVLRDIGHGKNYFIEKILIHNYFMNNPAYCIRFFEMITIFREK